MTDTLEALLGDPADPGNPLGHDAVVAADERGELLAAGEAMLDGYGLNAEFVPAELGGRFRQADEMARVVRAVFRRDCSLGLGYGVTSFIAAVPVWTSGDPAQRRRLADLLLRNGRAAAGYTELAHGNDFTRNELTARRDGASLILNGRKELVNNVARADAVVLFARTAEETGSRSHSHVLVDLTALPAGRRRHLPRFRTAGVRGCLLGGVEFRDCPVPADGVVGPYGGAMETVLTAFQVTRGVLPGVVIGALDTQVRVVLDFARGRTLYGRSVADLPHARATITGVFLDLLVADCLSTVVARALHVLPGETSVSTAAVKYLVPRLLHDGAYRLSTVLGARSYLREGPYGIFQKNMRDIPLVTFAHANAAVCQATMLPQLPRLARRSWLEAAPPPAALFRLGDPLPPLEYGALRPSARGADSLTAALASLGDAPELADLASVFTGELRELRRRCLDLPPGDRTVTARRSAFDLTDRYATVLAAAACAGVWRHADGGFLGDTGWLTGALWRLAGRLGRSPGPLPDGLERRLFTDLLARHDGDRTFDLDRRRLAGRHVP